MSLTCKSSYEFNVLRNKLVKICGFLSFQRLIFYNLKVRLHIVLAYICYEMLCVNHIVAAIAFLEFLRLLCVLVIKSMCVCRYYVYDVVVAFSEIDDSQQKIMTLCLYLWLQCVPVFVCVLVHFIVLPMTLPNACSV